MARLSPETCGERVWDVLAMGRYPTRKRIADIGNLTEAQVTRGLTALSDLFGGRAPWLRVRISREWCYALATNDRDVREHADRWFRTEITRARHQLNWWKGVHEEHPTDENEMQLEQARRRLYDLRFARKQMTEGGEEAAAA